MAKERNIITRATFDIAARDRARGALLGLAAGDAVGTRVEFHPPGAFMPLTDVVGGGPFGPEPGQWTDDRSMALCLAESMIDCGGHDSADQMRCCGRWWKQGTFSPTGRCFDIDGPAGDQESPPAGTGDGFSGGGHPPDREAAATGAPLTQLLRRAATRSPAKTFQASPEIEKQRLKTERRRCRPANSRRGRRWRHPGPRWPARSPTPS